ncbi:MAG TPA: hypothetical protein VMU81_24350 [Acetobacteraceae bacterium]|nr:hypothetical protein [Acetobacteraceae bacterium]
MSDESTAAHRTDDPSGPPQDRTGEAVPTFIAHAIYVIAVIAEYGHHILDMLESRIALRGFTMFARFFGTTAHSVIAAHIRRGIMRAVALDRMLRARAATGQDLRSPPPRAHCGHHHPAAATGPTGTTPPPTAASRPARGTHPHQPLTIDTLPTMQQLDAEVRRRSVGSSIAEICRDLGVSPILCESMFVQRISFVVRAFGGNFDRFVQDLRRREKRFRRELRQTAPNLDRLEVTAESARRALGFLIGESLANLFRRAAAATPAGAGASPAMSASSGSAVTATATGPP